MRERPECYGERETRNRENDERESGRYIKYMELKKKKIVLE